MTLTDVGPATGDLDELQVADASHLLVRLGDDCAPLQFVRELTQNAIEGVSMRPDGRGGTVVWDIDWHRVEQSNGRERKLCVIDTGIGMTHEAMRYFVNHLAASGKNLGARGSFGVGGKIAAGAKNPHGVEYKSWVDGHGALVRFGRHDDGRWGLLPQTWPDGHTDYWRALTDEDKPWVLRGESSGTQVTLLGDSDLADTTQAPKAITEGRARWLTRYANSRWLRLPAGVDVLVRDGAKIKRGSWDTGTLTRVHGQQHFLEARSIDHGVLDLDELRVHWWILDEDHKGRRAEGLEWQSTGHLAAILTEYDELYDMLPPTRGGYQRLQEWGIRHAYERVVLYLEPMVAEDRLGANLSRTALLLDHEPLPWTTWGEQFRSNMPDEIRALQERVAQHTSSAERGQIVATRLKDALPALRIGRYRPPRQHAPARPATDLTAAPRATTRPAQAPAPTGSAADHHDREETMVSGDGTPTAELTTPPPALTGPADQPDEDELDEDFDSEDLAALLALPTVLWISSRHTPPTRAVGDLEDRAGRYDPHTHTLTINEDFRVFAAQTRHWTGVYHDVPGAKYVVDAVLKEWIETSLTEVVRAARAEIAGSPAWTDEHLAALTSEEALSAAALVRVSSTQLIRKSLAQRLGKR